MSAPTPRGRDEIRTAALDAAERLLRANPPGSVSMRAIAEEANVTYSLLNRHLGSKQAIVDAMLARFEDRWRVRTAGADLDGALRMMMGDDPDAGTFLRLLAWSILSGDADLSTYRRHSAMHELLPLVDEAGGEASGEGPDAETVVAAGMAMIYGWRFFNPFITRMLDLEGADVERLHTEMGRILRERATG